MAPGPMSACRGPFCRAGRAGPGRRAGGRVESGGAALVQLRCSSGGGTEAQRGRQRDHGGPARAWVRQRQGAKRHRSLILPSDKIISNGGRLDVGWGGRKLLDTRPARPMMRWRREGERALAAGILNADAAWQATQGGTCGAPDAHHALPPTHGVAPPPWAARALAAARTRRAHHRHASWMCHGIWRQAPPWRPQFQLLAWHFITRHSHSFTPTTIDIPYLDPHLFPPRAAQLQRAV
jgi:hypothetical protein